MFAAFALSCRFIVRMLVYVGMPIIGVRVGCGNDKVGMLEFMLN